MYHTLYTDRPKLDLLYHNFDDVCLDNLKGSLDSESRIGYMSGCVQHTETKKVCTSSQFVGPSEDNSGTTFCPSVTKVWVLIVLQTSHIQLHYCSDYPSHCSDYPLRDTFSVLTIPSGTLFVVLYFRVFDRHHQ